MKRGPMKKGASKPLTSEQRAELTSLAALRDERSTPRTPRSCSTGPGQARPVLSALKQQLTLRLDAHVVAWFKGHHSNEGYQTRIIERS